MTSSLLRELREEDAEQVAALFLDAFGAARKLDAREVASWLRDPDLRHLRNRPSSGSVWASSSPRSWFIC